MAIWSPPRIDGEAAQILEPEAPKVRDLAPVLVEARLQGQDPGSGGDHQGFHPSATS